MTTRRTFFQAAALPLAAQTGAEGAQEVRGIWLRHLDRLAGPVLRNLAAGSLKREMPVETTGNPEDRRKYTHLEALGRLLAGIAPWLEASLPESAERASQQSYAELARRAIHSATDPKSPDYLNFTEGGQPLVDAAFLAHAILRAPRELWEKLDRTTRRNLADSLAAVRVVHPPFNNWLLFAATVEAALAHIGERWDPVRIDYAVRQHEQWYAGDGHYKDGPSFHWDYYNSYVIHPMLLDVLLAMRPHSKTWESFVPKALDRARRYAAIQERLIAPDGSFPPIGRSIAYRCGAFQLLAQMAMQGQLPESLPHARARGALTAVIRKTLEAPGTFDAKGWLRIGLCGHQPHLGETYISTGSLYLCATALLPLGLGPTHAFWTAPEDRTTWARIWNGEDMAADHAL